MLYALLLETVAEKRLGGKRTQLSGYRRGTWFRVWKMTRDELIEAIIGISDWHAWEWRLTLKDISERRRKRKLQRLFWPLIRWLNESTSSKLRKNSNQLSLTHLAA